MFETEADIQELQALIERSEAQMGRHMRSIVKPERRLSARQVVGYLEGIKHVAFATVNGRGEPRVSPLDGLFIRGRFHVSTGGHAARLRHVRRRPQVSLTHYSGDDIAVTVHGTATVIGRDDPGSAELEPVYVDVYGSSPFTWGEGVVFIRVEPSEMFTYATHPERFPG